MKKIKLYEAVKTRPCGSRAQPGSSVVTSLSPEEAKPKHCAWGFSSLGDESDGVRTGMGGVIISSFLNPRISDRWRAVR